MVKKIKKGEKGRQTKYLSRRKAIRTLQLSLGEFRKLCILKGIHPRDPKNKSRNTGRKVFYHKKDLTFLKHEPLINHLRTVSATKKKIAAYSVRGQKEQLERAQSEIKSLPSLAPILKERYPEFRLAVRDLDDALTTLHLFAHVTSNNETLVKHSQDAARLVREFDWYVIKTRSLNKAFISIKGYFYQTFVEGQNITWLVPHKFKTDISKRYPAVIYNSFVEFYKSLMSFVLYKLYHDAGLKYPPVLDAKKDDDSYGLEALLVEYDDTKTPKERKLYIPKTAAQRESEKRIKSLDLKSLAKLDEKKSEEPELIEVKEEPIDDEEQKKIFEAQKKKIENQSKLFEGMKVFISREVPRHPVEFVLLCFGAQISFEGPTSPFPENDPTITHQIVDREFQRKRYLDRTYVQPQWIFDCLNERLLIPAEEYFPGKNLPAHLSPFAPNFVDGYTPRRREQLNLLKKQFEETGYIDKDSIPNLLPDEEFETVNPNEGLTAEEIYAKELEAEKGGKSYSQNLEEEKNRPKVKKVNTTKEKKKLFETPAPQTVMSGKKRWLFQKLSAKQRERKKRVSELIYRRNKIEEEERKKIAASKKK